MTNDPAIEAAWLAVDEDATPWAITQQAVAAARPVIVAEIVKWLQGRTGAHGGGFTSADDVADAIGREFGA